jgi:hypothetical protein
MVLGPYRDELGDWFGGEHNDDLGSGILNWPSPVHDPGKIAYALRRQRSTQGVLAKGAIYTGNSAADRGVALGQMPDRAGYMYAYQFLDLQQGITVGIGG